MKMHLFVCVQVDPQEHTHTHKQAQINTLTFGYACVCGHINSVRAVARVNRDIKSPWSIKYMCAIMLS